MDTEVSRRKDLRPWFTRGNECYDRQIGPTGLALLIQKLRRRFQLRLQQSWLSVPAHSNLLVHEEQIRYHRSESPSFRVLRNAVIAIFLLGSIGSLSSAVFINFDNCLGNNVITSSPLQLQFVPYFVNVIFNATAPSHNLNITVYGNVSGIATEQPYPAPNDPQWGNPNDTVGKITDLSPTNNKYSTLFTTFDVLDYSAYKAPSSRFCNSTVHGHCPLGPAFYTNGSDPNQLPAFSVAQDLYSPYFFTTITSNMQVKTGDASDAVLACISASITPDLGRTISDILTYLTALVLLVVGIATASAAILSPWGTLDVFRWTSNYGRDADLLRLITPGFGDCLQYIQFVVLSGSLSLNYPGFYQPVVSRASWSVLMFNESFVSHGNGTQSLRDGIYAVNGTYGLDQMSQLVGMTADNDIWAGMIIWLLVIITALVVLIQIGFICRWAYRHISNTQEEDLRAKNMPFTVGNAIRIVFNYFLLPIVALSMFQLVVADHSPASTVGFAALTLIAVIGFAGWLFWIVASTRPRSYLFDDLPTVLLYGPLYNTYSDHAAAFALVPLMMTFLRGIAIGAVQPSGIAQLVLLAICEVILILTLNAFRPFHSPTSMNVIHTVFAVVRLVTVMLSVAFVPELSVGDVSRGWIGYVILLLHAITLFVGFFLHSLQTIIEVFARLAGAGGEEGVEGGVARGGLVKVFGMRQLSRRNPRRPGKARNSVGSDAAILGHENDQKSVQFNGGRSRSMSGSSAILLNRQAASDGRTSLGLDSISAAGGGHSHTGSGGVPYTPSTPGGASTFSYAPGASQNGVQGGSPREGIINLKSAEAADPYYRPPRPRRVTMDLSSPATHSRGSWTSGDWTKRWSEHSPEQEGSPDPMEGPSVSGRVTPLPAHLGNARDRSDSNGDEPRRSKTDYAIREVDFYYGVRGPALSNLPTRRLKTGPADPTGPVSSASGWFKSLFGGKTKEKGKGFEVVRSSRVPQLATPQGEIALADQKPYKDDPEPAPPQKPREFELDDEGDAVGGGTRHLPETNHSLSTSEDEYGIESSSDEEDLSRLRSSQVSQFPPSLPVIEAGPDISLPSRIASKASSKPSRGNTRKSEQAPTVPRKSSRRTSSQTKIDLDSDNDGRLSIIPAPPPSSTRNDSSSRRYDLSLAQGLQPSSSVSQRLPFGSTLSSSLSKKRLSTGLNSPIPDQVASTGIANEAKSSEHARNPSSALGSFNPSLRGDRPSSLGYVQQHRASDNVHIAEPGEQSFHESAAAVIDDDRRRSISPETRLLQ